MVFDHLLAMAPDQVVVPMVGAVLLSPILHSLDIPAPMVHLNGPTGSHKTSIACAALSLFGDAAPAQPTDTWTSTANSIQRLGWYLKDAPLLLDDYKAGHVKPNQVTFLLQNYGDNMARGRLDANSDMRATFPIRGVMLSSGEDQPEGEASILARILTVAIERRDVHRGHLTAVQQNASALKGITVGYLAWLAEGVDTEGLRDRYQAVRATMLSQLEDVLEHATNPGRIASNVAILAVAWETFGRFLNARSHWRPVRVQQWLERCDFILLNLARGQLDLTTQERYSALFLESIRALLASGQATMFNLEGATWDMPSSQVLLGAYDRRGTYLIANSAYDEVARHLRTAGRSLNVSQRALSQMLYADGILRDTEPPTLLVRKRINGARPWCWHLPPGFFSGEG
jgi:hypothetical protein